MASTLFPTSPPGLCCSSSSQFISSPRRWSPPGLRAPGLSRRWKSATLPVISAEAQSESAKLVTFLGKGGSGKTTAAILAAQYYAKEGLRTCLVLNSHDLTAEVLLGRKIGHSPSKCNQYLTAVRLQTTKLLLEPLARIKKADARVNLTQGILEGVVGEELGVMLGMDSILAALELEKYTNFLGRKTSSSPGEFDIVVFDGIGTDETLRLIGSSERARWYLKYVRSLADKTDIGRLTAPSILRLGSESLRSNGGSSDGKSSSEIWDEIEHVLERACASFNDSSKFRCYVVMDPSRPTCISSALRYWGCAIQAGTSLSGAFAFAEETSLSSLEHVKKKMSPLAFSLLPYLSTDMPIDWDSTIDALGNKAREILSTPSNAIEPVVQFDSNNKTVTLFMPGFDKTEVKLYQYRGGTELLVEAGDQRRIIHLPKAMQGKVSAAKFTDRSLVVTLR